MDQMSRRREFLRGLSMAGVGAVALPAWDACAAEASEERVVVGVMGLGRGFYLSKIFASLPDVDVRYLCDTDGQRVETCRKGFADLGYEGSQGTQDVRRVLDDPDVDVLVCAAPNHWHAPATIMACQAGKHVYVEKPCSHNPWEGEAMVAVAQRQAAVVQQGTQRRSSPGTQLAIQRIHDGAIGKAYLARAWYSSARGSIGTGHVAAVPQSLKYDLWQGPAPHRDFRDNVVHYNWHWRWHWGNGELGNNGIHTLDLCRWGLDVSYPSRVTSVGGRYAYQDDQETPDTHTVGFEFGDEKMITWHGVSCNRHPVHDQAFVSFYGTEGSLELAASGSFQIFDRANQVQEAHQEADESPSLHVANFLAAVRQADSSTLNAPILEGHRSTLLCHLGNIAHRTGRSLTCDPVTGRIMNDPDAMRHWKREYAPGWEPVT